MARTQQPPAGIIPQINWCIEWIYQLRGRLGNSGGGGTTILPSTQVGFGSNDNVVTGNSDFTYNVDTSIFSVGFGGNPFLYIGGEKNKQLIGDYHGAFNNTYLQVSDSSSTVLVNGVYDGVSAYGQMLLLNGANHLYVIGDVDGVYNGASATIGASGIGTNWYYMVGDNNGNYLDINQSNDMYSIGDSDGISNGTYLLLDNYKQKVSIFSGSSRFLFLDAIAAVYAIGDIDNSKNSTYLQEDDLSKVAIQTNAIAFPTMQISNPSTGDTVVINDGVRGIYIDPTVLLDTLTIQMPAKSVDGQECIILFGGQVTNGTVVTSLTITGGNLGQTLVYSGAFGTNAEAGVTILCKYRESTTQWYLGL